MRRHHLISAVIIAFFGLTQVAMAAGGGGNAGGMGAGRMPDGARSSGMPGGMSGDHMSPSGQANGNAQSKPDATRGMDRAQERMNEHGAAHQQATAKERHRARTHAASKKGKKAKKARKMKKAEPAVTQ